MTRTGAFLTPILPLRRGCPGSLRRCSTRCALITGGSGGRRRPGTPPSKETHNLDSLPPTFVSEVRRLIQSRSFLQQVKETLQWPYVRYTGILFQKEPICISNPDGIPEQLRTLHRRADYKFIDIPHGVTRRADRKSGGSTGSANVRLCALFETYGIDGEHLRELQSIADELEESNERQLRAWADVGQSMRTETDLTSKTGPEIFVEDHRDLYE